MTLAELAEESKLAARTIRFYIARGLLNGPVKGGRGAEYTGEHLKRLERIRDLQASGHALSVIARILNGHDSADGSLAEAPPATAWSQYTVADDVIVWVKSGGSPWRTRQIRTALHEFTRRVGRVKNEPGKD